MPMIAAGVVAASVIGGMMGNSAAKKGRQAQAAAAAAAYAELQKIGMPPDLSREVILREFQNQGVLTPELEQDIDLQASQVAQLKGQVSSFTPAGTQELLRRSVGGNRYTQGQQRLDTLLLDKSALTPVQRQASALGQDIQRANLAASGQAELNKNLAQRFGQETQERLTSGLGGIETTVQGQLTAAQAAEKQRQNVLRDIMFYGSGSREALDASGNPIIDKTSGNVVRESYSDIDGGTGLDRALQLKQILATSGINDQSLSGLFGSSTNFNALPKIEQDLFTSRGGAGGMEMVRQKLTTSDPYAAAPYTSQRAAYNKALSEAGKLGQAYSGDVYSNVMGGAQGGAMGDFLNRIAQSVQTRSGSQEGGVEGLTEQGLASEQQRANYEALNKLLGRTTSESKYRVDDPTKYRAGKILINPEQI